VGTGGFAIAQNAEYALPAAARPGRLESADHPVLRCRRLPRGGVRTSSDAAWSKTSDRRKGIRQRNGRDLPSIDVGAVGAESRASRARMEFFCGVRPSDK